MKYNKTILTILLIIAICIVPGCKEKTENTESSLQETSKYPVYLLASDDLDGGLNITAEEKFRVVSKSTNRYVDKNATKFKKYSFNGNEYTLEYRYSESSLYSDNHSDTYIIVEDSPAERGFVFYKNTEDLQFASFNIDFSFEDTTEEKMKNKALELMQTYFKWSSDNYEYRIMTSYYEIWENGASGEHVDYFMTSEENKKVSLYRLYFTELCDGGRTFNNATVTFSSLGSIVVDCYYEDYGDTFTDISSKVSIEDISDSVSAFVKNYCMINEEKGLSLKKISDDIMFYKKDGKVYAKVKAEVEHEKKEFQCTGNMIAVCVELGELS